MSEFEMHIAQNWRLRGSRLRLEGSNCQACGKPHFPGRTICPEEGCGHDNRQPVEVKSGIITSTAFKIDGTNS